MGSLVFVALFADWLELRNLSPSYPGHLTYVQDDNIEGVQEQLLVVVVPLTQDPLDHQLYQVVLQGEEGQRLPLISSPSPSLGFQVLAPPPPLRHGLQEMGNGGEHICYGHQERGQ